MSKTKQKDNSTLKLKASLRRNLLQEVAAPVVMETHAGYGHIFDECYRDVSEGIAFEMNQEKASFLAKQRPTWSVYECDCVSAIAAGAGAHLTVNFLDIDPYGQPWPVVDAFLGSNRNFPETLAIVVNDGLRGKIKINGGWDVESLAGIVSRYGTTVMYKNYLEVCQELIKEKTGQRGYTLTRWAGYYCGHANAMTHYAAVLTKRAPFGGD